jgi:trigger factor
MTTAQDPHDKAEPFRAVDDTRRELDIEIPAGEAAREFELVLDRTAAKVKLDGFRLGRAPREMVKRLFYEDIRQSVIDALAPRAVHEALRERNLSPLQAPVVSAIRYQEGEPLRFTASFEVWPEWELPDYRSIQVRKTVAPVEDKDVDEALAALRQRAAEYIPVEDRGAAEGDYVAVEIRGRDLATKRFFPTEKTAVLAGHADNEPTLNEQLPGLRIGDERTFRISYPPDHANRKLAGKEVEYYLKVLSLKARKLPELNDDFARSLGEYAGLDDLRTRLRNEIRSGRELQARREAADEFLDILSGRIAPALPEALVRQEAEAILKEAVTTPTGEPARIRPADLDPLRAEARRRAERKVRNHMILMKIAQAERLAVSEDEADDEIRRLARSHDVPFLRLKETFEREGRREELRTSLLLKKSIDFLARSAIME